MLERLRGRTFIRGPSHLQLPIVERVAGIDIALFPAQELERLPRREAIAVMDKTGTQFVERARGHRQAGLVTCDFQRLYEGNRMFLSGLEEDDSTRRSLIMW